MARSLRQRKAMKDRPLSEQALHAMFSMARNPCDDPWAEYSESPDWFKRHLLIARQTPMAPPSRQRESRKRSAPGDPFSPDEASGSSSAGVSGPAPSSSSSLSASSSSAASSKASTSPSASISVSALSTSSSSSSSAMPPSTAAAASDLAVEPKASGGGGGKKVKKKMRLVRRGTSPSHFLMSELEELRFGPQSSLDAPNRDRIDALFRAVGCLYFRPREVEDEQSVWVSGEYDISEYTGLDMLVSPLRRSNPIDSWTPKQIALFECGICKFGKNFSAISQLIMEKTTAEVVDFYYGCWKKSTHYQIWKQRQRPAAQLPRVTPAVSSNPQASQP